VVPSASEAFMPRFVGRTAISLWWEIIAFVVLVIAIFLVLALTGVIHIFGS
jgi:hypothetical protein